MNVKIFSLVLLTLNVHANIKNDFLTEYFVYKQVPIIAGFSCNNAEDDFSLFHRFSNKGIVTVLDKLNNNKKLDSILNVNYWKIGIFFDIRCYDYQTVLSTFLEASENRMFDELRSWLILGSNLTEVLEVIDDRAFGMSTDFVIAIPSDDETYELHDAYNMFSDRGTVLNVTYLGSWNIKSGFNIALTQSKFSRRCNLHLFILKAVFFKLSYKKDDERLEDYFEDYNNATKDGQAKFGFHLLNHLAQLYNFTLQPQESLAWKPNDTIGPVVRAIMNNSVDFTGSPLFMTIPRTYILRSVHGHWPFRTCFIFRNPQPKNLKLHEILTPLTDEVWYLTILLIALISVILFMLLKNEGITSLYKNISNTLLIIVGALCQQGTDEPMTRLSTRIVFLFLMIFSLLVYNYYSASIVSVRLNEPIFKINDSLMEFGKMHLKMSSEPMVYLEFFMKKPEWDASKFYKQYWLKIPVAKRLMLPEIGMRLVKEGGFAYHTHPNVGYPLIEKFYSNREICELMEVHVARPMFTSFSVTMNSSFVEIARVGLTKISETGLKYRQLSRWRPRKPRCRKDILNASKVTIYEFAPHLLLLGFGMIVAFVTYVVEIFTANYSGYIKQQLMAYWTCYLLRERSGALHLQ